MIINRGADLNQATNQGFTPLYIGCQEGHLEIVRLLIGGGADIDKPNDRGCTPLYIGCFEGHLEIVRSLIKGGADIDKTNDRGLTSLDFGCLRGHLDVARLLLASGAKGNTTAKESQVLMQEATSRSHLELSAWLGERVGWSALQYACEAGWEVWSPSTHKFFPSLFRKSVVAVLSVDRRKNKVGKDVMLHVVSFCGWDWFAEAKTTYI